MKNKTVQIDRQERQTIETLMHLSTRTAPNASAMVFRKEIAKKAAAPRFELKKEEIYAIIRYTQVMYSHHARILTDKLSNTFNTISLNEPVTFIETINSTST